MIKQGDTVIYGANGVCDVSAIEERVFGGQKSNYYILCPRSNSGSTVYVPVDNEKLASRMKRILTEKEIYDLIGATEKAKLDFRGSDNERKAIYKECFETGERGRTISLVKAVLAHQEEIEPNGKRLHICDERFLNSAVKMLYEEFTLVLKIEPEDVLRLLKDE